MDILFWLGIISYAAALICGFASLELHAVGRTFEGNANLAKLFLFGAIGLLTHYAWWQASVPQ
jgi:hypothetical protein